MITRIRAGTALALVILVVLVIGYVIQRTVVAAVVRVVPSARDRILAAWLAAVAASTLAILHRVGGGQWNRPPRIPHDPGILVLMNHQSLLDIPLVVQSVHGGYPLIVTRERYLHAKYLLISHILRLYRFPIVEPGRAAASQIEGLRGFAREAHHPMVIYPEGHRSRNGELGPFKKGGLGGILAARRWQVYLIVVDGFWQCARLPDFLAGLAHMKGRIECLGPFDSPAEGEDPGPWIERMRELMAMKLNDIRGLPGAASGPGRAVSGLTGLVRGEV